MLFSDFVVYCVYFVGCVSYCSLVLCIVVGICYVWLCVCVMLLRCAAGFGCSLLVILRCEWVLCCMLTLVFCLRFDYVLFVY